MELSGSLISPPMLGLWGNSRASEQSGGGGACRGVEGGRRMLVTLAAINMERTGQLSLPDPLSLFFFLSSF